MTSKPITVRVTMTGNKAQYELMRDGEKLSDVSEIDLVELSLQCTSALRFSLGANGAYSYDNRGR
jgi:hypothetical protein